VTQMREGILRAECIEAIEIPMSVAVFVERIDRACRDSRLAEPNGGEWREGTGRCLIRISLVMGKTIPASAVHLQLHLLGGGNSAKATGLLPTSGCSEGYSALRNHLSP
jgi:hypothetical protein